MENQPFLVTLKKSSFDLSLSTNSHSFGDDKIDFLKECLQAAVEADLGKLTFEQVDKLVQTGYFTDIDGKPGYWREPKCRVISFPKVIHASQNSTLFYLLSMITSPTYYYETSDGKNVPLRALYSSDQNAKIRWKQKLHCPSRVEVDVTNQDFLEWFSCETSVKVEIVVRLYDKTHSSLLLNQAPAYKRVFQPENFAKQFNFSEAVLKVPRRWRVTIECSATRDIIVSGVIFQYPALDDPKFDPENYGYRLEY